MLDERRVFLGGFSRSGSGQNVDPWPLPVFPYQIQDVTGHNSTAQVYGELLVEVFWHISSSKSVTNIKVLAVLDMILSLRKESSACRE